MQRTAVLKASSPVVVTLLSPSWTTSQSFKQWLINNTSNRSNDDCDLDCINQQHQNDSNSTSEDDLDRWGATAWNSVSVNVSCNNQSPPTLLHIVSPTGFSSTKTRNSPLSLLSIQHASSIQESRCQLAAAFAQQGSSLYVRLRKMFRQPLLPSHLLRHHQTLLQWKENETHIAMDDSASSHNNIIVAESPRRPQLKEIALPVENINQIQLPASGTTGVYMASPQLAIRPLPTAMHDRFLTAPTLVFHQSTSSSASELQPTTATKEWHSIGVTSSRKGQLMQYKQGIDVRLCSSTTRESMFCEAHESMLAGSLHELQSTRVLLGNKLKNNNDDPKTNQMDCWVEVRANLKTPSGYWTHNKTTTTPRFAKAPDIPYE